MRVKKRVRPWIFLVSAVAIGAMAASAVPDARDDEEDSTPASCCVANPRHAGICEVELGPEETCADVLAYLNNAASVGKTYCGNTSIRMGWKQVECQEEE